MLPLIYLNPSDGSCTHSTLVYTNDQAKHLNIEIPYVTFDQPLPIKAFELSKLKICALFFALVDFII